MSTKSERMERKRLKRERLERLERKRKRKLKLKLDGEDVLKRAKKRAKRLAIDDDVRESKISIAARKARQEPADVTVRKKIPTKKVRVVAVRLGFDGTKRIRPGVEFVWKAPMDEEGAVILPTWMLLKKDYVPEAEPTLPWMPVRGGASAGGVKAGVKL